MLSVTPIGVGWLRESDEKVVYIAVLLMSPFYALQKQPLFWFPEGDFHPQEKCQDTIISIYSIYRIYSIISTYFYIFDLSKIRILKVHATEYLCHCHIWAKYSVNECRHLPLSLMEINENITQAAAPDSTTEANVIIKELFLKYM